MTIADVATLSRFLTGTDSNSFTNAQLVLASNNSYERITGKILSETAAGRWKWGDISYTALPTYTLNLVAGTAFYQIDSLTGPLIILGAEVADQDGIYHKLEPITLHDIYTKGGAQSEYYKTNGRPVEYEKREHGLVLYPAPAAANVTLTNGLRIFFLRGASAITDMTSTTAVGIPLPWHDLLAFEAAYTFAIAKNLSNASFLRSEVDRKEKELMSFISRRDQDEIKVMTMKTINYT